VAGIDIEKVADVVDFPVDTSPLHVPFIEPKLILESVDLHRASGRDAGIVPARFHQDGLTIEFFLKSFFVCRRLFAALQYGNCEYYADQAI